MLVSKGVMKINLRRTLLNNETMKWQNEIAKQRNETAKYVLSGSLLVLQVL